MQNKLKKIKSKAAINIRMKLKTFKSIEIKIYKI